MPTIIDSLVVLLGLDPTEFKKGTEETDAALKKTRENADRHNKEMEARAKATAAAFSKVKNEVLGMLGAYLGFGAVKAFVEKINASDAAVGRLAMNMGVATSELSAWEKLSTKFGSSAEDIDGAFRTTFAMMQDIQKNGSSAALGPLSRLLGAEGIGQLVRAAQSGDVLKMLKLLQSSAASSTDRAGALYWMQAAGYSETTFNFMREIGDQLERQLEGQRALNTVTDRDVQLAKERNAIMKAYGDLAERAGRKILNSSYVTGVWHRFLGTWAGAAHYISKLFGSDEKAPAGSAPAPTPGGNAQSQKSLLSQLDAKAGLPDGTLAAMRQQESRGNDQAVSPKGAQGPFQFMPKTWQSYGHGGDPFNFEAAAKAAAEMMHDLMRQYGGDLRKALMAYNGGAGGASGRYSESTNYADSILSSMGRKGGSNKTEVSIGELHIHTKATDGVQTGVDFTKYLNDNYALASHGNGGLF